MIQERESETAPEAWFELFVNASGETIAAGSVLCWDISSAGNGSRVVKPTTAALSAFAGIADVTAADGATFRAQTKGWRQVGALVISDTVQIVNPGDILIPVNGQWYLTRSGPGDGKSGLIIAAETVPTSNPTAVALRRVIIRGC